MTIDNSRHDIVPASLAVKAMRDNGYKNIAYALAELIDNSIQAGLHENELTQVELLCADITEMRTQRRTTRIHKIGVLDNSCGMNAHVLRMALQFGNGTYLNPEDHTGIGRFGMGLPSSSISQCRRVDVWSWQNGPNNAIHTYLDLDEISNGRLWEVPAPKEDKIPSIWRQVGTAFEKSGTLVIWSQIDRSLWRTSQTIIEKSDFLIGRMYRRFIKQNRVTIRYATFDINVPDQVQESFAKPNDPLYLMSGTSCPGDLNNIQPGEPMFITWGTPSIFKVIHNEQSHQVTINYSIAKDEARVGHNPGSRDHGQHARKNVGVSIMRADRELELDPAWSDPSDPRDRWWGAEINFPPSLDELFGVTNNKQTARYFSDLAKTNVEELVEADQSFGAAREQYGEEKDPRWPLFEMALDIDKNIKSMRRMLEAQTKGKRSRKRYDESEDANSPEAMATQATNQRKEIGFEGLSDSDEDQPKEKKIVELKEGLIEDNYSAQDAFDMASYTINRGYKYQFSYTDIDSPAFFNVKTRAGAIIISLNTSHPAYRHLIEVLEDDIDEDNEEKLRSRLIQASNGLKLLLTAWARYEDEQPLGIRRIQAQEARLDWGRVARQFLSNDDPS